MCQCSLGDEMSEIRERKIAATSDFVTAFGDIFKSCPINPGNGGRHIPPCAIVLDDLCGGQIEVGREKGDPLHFTKLERNRESK